MGRLRRCHVAFAGRIDNRSDLISQGLSGSQEDLLLGAYERWGLDLVHHLVGDFAFALWDPAVRRLFCARDAVGARTVYYRFDGRTFSFGSQLRQLTPREASLPPFEERYFGHFLLEGHPHLTLTPFQGIEKLPGGHLLVVDEGGVRQERWWRPEELETIEYADDREYAAHFFELFHDSVAAQLAAHGPVWCELSGGLDSSSIACMAREIYCARGIEPPDFTTLTGTYDDPRAGDEPRYYESVIERCGVRAETVVVDAHDLFQDMEEAAVLWDEPADQIRFFSYQRRLAELFAQEGVDVLLSGLGAEVVVGFEVPHPLHLPDLLRTGRWGEFLKEVKAWQEAERLPFANVLGRYVLKPLFGPPLNKYYDLELVLPPWIQPDLARRLGLRKQVNHGWMPRRFDSVASQWLYEKIGRLQVQIYRGLLEKRLDPRYPFLSRPLLDFCLSTPFSGKNKPKQFKPMLRDAMKGTLPEVVRTRKDKGGLGPLVIRSMSRQWRRLEPILRAPVLSALGFVDQQALYDTLKLLSYGKARRTPLLTAPLALEFWARSVLDGTWQKLSHDLTSESSRSTLQPARKGGELYE